MAKIKTSSRHNNNGEAWIRKFIAVVTVLAFFSYIGLVTFYPFQQIKMEFVNLAMGWIGGVATAVITFYFGSSSGSDEKTAIIDKAMNKGFPPSPPSSN